MNFFKKNWSGVLVCLVIAIPSWLLGNISCNWRSSDSNYSRNDCYNVLEQ